MYCVLNERLCISLCLSVHSHSLLRSGTVHILHYNLPPALSQWWYSQHFALYNDLHFSHIPPISSQRHHWVPEHLFSPHGDTWVPVLSLSKTGFKAITCNLHVEKSYFLQFKADWSQISHFLLSPHSSCWSAVGSTRREGGVPAYVNLSASSMLMIAMQYTSNPGNTSHWLRSTHGNAGCNSNGLVVCFPPSLSLSIVGVSNEAQTRSVEGIKQSNIIFDPYLKPQCSEKASGSWGWFCSV